MTTLGKILLFAAWLVSSAGCSLFSKDKQDETADWSASKIYTEAKTALKEGNYDNAVKYFEKLQARYPFGRYAQQAQLELIYVHYKNDEPDQAIAAADRFIKDNPRHPFVDYAYYLKGLANFSRGSGIVERLLPSDATRTDTNLHLQSFNDFGELVQKFPNSKYAPDARQRMVYLRNNLAAYETHVAEYYLSRKAYVAAVNRAKYVVEHYDRTASVPDALTVMTRAYTELGLRDLAADSLRVLQANFPDSPQYQRASAVVEGKPEPKEKSSMFGWLGL